MNYKVIKFQEEEYKQFDSKEEAFEYMEELHGNDCMDNKRFCYLPFSLNQEISEDYFQELEDEYQAYLDQKDWGCCASMDEKIFVGDMMCVIGCNYGH